MLTLPELWDNIARRRARIDPREAQDRLLAVVSMTDDSLESRELKRLLQDTWEYGERLHRLGRPVEGAHATDDDNRLMVTLDPMAVPEEG